MPENNTFKESFLQIMEESYGLDAAEVEEFIDNHLEIGLDVDDTPEDLADAYATKYDLDSHDAINFGYPRKASIG